MLRTVATGWLRRTVARVDSAVAGKPKKKRFCPDLTKKRISKNGYSVSRRRRRGIPVHVVPVEMFRRSQDDQDWYEIWIPFNR
jgi:hypothetical protein